MNLFNTNSRTSAIIYLLGILLVGCQTGPKNSEKEIAISTEIQLPERPNILWLVTEDMGSYIPSFGDSTIVTPNLSRLAAEGVVYPNP